MAVRGGGRGAWRLAGLGSTLWTVAHRGPGRVTAKKCFEEESIRFTTNFPSASGVYSRLQCWEEKWSHPRCRVWSAHAARVPEAPERLALAAGRTSDEERTKPAAKTLDLDQLSWASWWSALQTSLHVLLHPVTCPMWWASQLLP